MGVAAINKFGNPIKCRLIVVFKTLARSVVIKIIKRLENRGRYLKINKFSLFPVSGITTMNEHEITNLDTFIDDQANPASEVNTKTSLRNGA